MTSLVFLCFKTMTLSFKWICEREMWRRGEWVGEGGWVKLRMRSCWRNLTFKLSYNFAIQVSLEVDLSNCICWFRHIGGFLNFKRWLNVSQIEQHHAQMSKFKFSPQWRQRSWWQGIIEVYKKTSKSFVDLRVFCWNCPKRLQENKHWLFAVVYLQNLHLSN